MDTTEKQRTKKATRPASRWRTRWRALCDFTYSDAPVSRRCGEEYWGKREWPSRDTAETWGQQWEREWGVFATYLGAFPVEDA